MSELSVLTNSPNNITLAGKTYKVSKPTLSDLAEAETYGKDLKQSKRKEYIKQYTELFSNLPKDMPQEEKKEIVNSILPQLEVSAKEKLELLAAMPESWSEDKKDKQLLKFVLERNGVEWMETLYILWLCIRKHQPSITLDDVKAIVTPENLDSIIKVISPNKLGESEKNV